MQGSNSGGRRLTRRHVGGLSGALVFIAIVLRVIAVNAHNNQNTEGARALATATIVQGHELAKPGNFNSPDGIAVDARGYMYIADEKNVRIQKLSPRGKPVAIWGKPGTVRQVPDKSGFNVLRVQAGFGQIVDPRGVALDARGNLYVVDWLKNRIEVFGPNGKVRAEWGQPVAWGETGTKLGQLDGVEYVAVDGRGNVYVEESQNDRVQKFSPTGKPLAAWRAPGAFPDGYGDLAGIAVDSHGTIYVADRKNDTILKLSPSGALLDSWGSEGSGRGQIGDPGGLAVDRKGDVYVADANNARIEKFSPSGTLLGQWGSYGWDMGQFQQPAAIALDRHGNMYVTDQGSDLITKLSPSGKPLAQFGEGKTYY